MSIISAPSVNVRIQGAITMCHRNRMRGVCQLLRSGSTASKGKMSPGALRGCNAFFFDAMWCVVMYVAWLAGCCCRPPGSPSRLGLAWRNCCEFSSLFLRAAALVADRRLMASWTTTVDLFSGFFALFFFESDCILWRDQFDLTRPGCKSWADDLRPEGQGNHEKTGLLKRILNWP